MANNQTQPAEETKKPKSNRFAIVFGALVLVGGTYGTVKYIHGQKHEETDDAQIESLISPVIPRVAGYIKEVRVIDNQMVKKGDTLVILDDKDFVIKLEEAEAALSAAQSNASVAGAGIPVVNANVSSAESNINTVDAQIEAAKVNLWRATQDYNRYANLIKDHTITQQQYEQASAAKQTAERQLDVLKAQRQNAARQTSAIGEQRNVYAGQVAAANASIKQRQAEIDAAKLNLSYTVITAAVDGQVSRVNLQPGQLLQAGQSLFNIVPENAIWVVGNFKETQLTKMKIGQKVTVSVDAYPDNDFEGIVTSFSPATGSKFSLLPPDNASGNFVKVVQRLPVKIDFVYKKDEKLKLLRAGMNVTVDVHVAN
ncbi:HlyD family secretion protein [Taibaiella lutea]|uniref:HlyD family secretion protein n=1 Tax=Taibaiella lutea TaxID=2608001 RepID=A0A5M6CMP5_9BACT|nr:HlyD family secretion protein [Taibaiella lutea]KAA5536481.1 HlyD family secretion protein [Taibaiella lutea]